MDLRLRTVEDEKADRDAAAAIAAVAEFAPGATTPAAVAEFAPGATAPASVAEIKTGVPGTAAVAELKTVRGILEAVAESSTARGTAAVAESTTATGSVADVSIAPGTTAVAIADAGNSAGRSRSCSELDVDFDLFVQSRASPQRALETSSKTRPRSLPEESKTRSPSLAESSKAASYSFPVKFEDETVAKFSTPPGNSDAADESWTAPAAGKSRSCSELEVDFDLFVQSRASPLRALEKSETTRPQSVPGKSQTHHTSPKPSFQPRSLHFPEHSENRPQSFVEASKTIFPIFSECIGKTTARIRCSSESEVDFEVFVQSRASPRRAPETSITRPEKSKTRPLSFAESQTSSCVPQPSQTRPLCFAESSHTTSCVPQPSQTRPLSLAESTQTTSCVPQTSQTRPLSFVESSETRFPIFGGSFGQATGRIRCSSESDVDFEIFVQSHASPRAPETSITRPLSFAESQTSCVPQPSQTRLAESSHTSCDPQPSQTRPLSLADSSKTRSSCSDGTSKTSPQRVPEDSRIRPPRPPKPSKSRPPPVPESFRPRHVSMEGQDNSLKDLQHLKKEPKKKSAWSALNPVKYPSGSPKKADSPKKAKSPKKENSPKKANKGKYVPLDEF